MAADPVLNFAKTTSSLGYAAGATTVVLTGGDGAKLPNPGVSGSFNLVWWNSTDYTNPTDDPNVEIVRCTARVGDSLTVVRAQESTADVNHNTGGKSYKLILSFTAKTYDDIESNKADLAGAAFVGAVTMIVDNNDNYIALTITNNDTTNNPNSAIITNAGTGNGLFIDQNGNGTALNIDSEATTATTVNIDATGGSNSLGSGGNVVRISTAGLSADARALRIINATTALSSAGAALLGIESNTVDLNTTRGLVDINVNNASSTGKAMRIFNAGSGDGLEINSDNAGARAIDIDAENTIVDALNIDCDVLTTGSIARFDSNSADTGTRNLIEIINDNTAAVNVTPLMVQQDAVIATNFKKVATFAGFTIYVSDGTTAEGALTGIAGDICLNGGTGAGQTAYCDANGTNWTDM